LSPRERDVALLVSEARGNAEIGRLLYIASNTVGYHLKQIYMKLDINSRVALTRVVLTRCPGSTCHALRI
jgi:DNA-binding CsgD family transcriptional regulator